jgi:hypothetical protein
VPTQSCEGQVFGSRSLLGTYRLSSTFMIYFMISMYSRTLYLHNGHSRTLYILSGLLRFRITFRVCASLRLRRINASFGHSFSLLARSLVLGPQDLVATDFKPCLARYSLIRPKKNKNRSYFHQNSIFYSSRLLLLTDDRQQSIRLGIGILGHVSRTLSFPITVRSGRSAFFSTTPHSSTDVERFWRFAESVQHLVNKRSRNATYESADGTSHL